MTKNDIIVAVGSLYPEAQVGIDFTVVETSTVGSLALWNNAMGAQPTPDQLAAALAAVQLAGYKGIQSSLIESSYQNATYNTAIAYMGTSFWTDQNSQDLILSELVVGALPGAPAFGGAWWDTNNAEIAMTATQLQGLALAIRARMNTNFVRRKQLLANIAAATTVAEVQAITW